MRKAFFFLIACIASVMGYFVVSSLTDDILLTGTAGSLQGTGIFFTGGNAGRIDFEVTPPNYSGAQIKNLNNQAYLTGIYWIQNVGWATFDNVGAGPVTLIPPVDRGERIGNVWTLSGYSWSENAGWIALSHGESLASGVMYDPSNNTLAGYGWSESLGWIPYGSGTVSGVSRGFIGKVHVIGQIGGSRAFDTDIYQIGGRYDGVSLSRFLSAVKKNFAYLIRNAQGKINTNVNDLYGNVVSFNKAIIYDIQDHVTTNNTIGYLTYTDILSYFNDTEDENRAIIARGIDIYINTGVINPFIAKPPRAIIALKNDNNQGGNIWIGGDVKRIEASLIAEGSLYSGDPIGNPPALSPYLMIQDRAFTQIPRNQLWITGLVATRNTIGGAAQLDNPVCPFMTQTCNYNSALQYDLNYFRNYPAGDPQRRAYKDDTRDEASVIIEYDPAFLANPPPGLENFR